MSKPNINLEYILNEFYVEMNFLIDIDKFYKNHFRCLKAGLL